MLFSLLEITAGVETQGKILHIHQSCGRTETQLGSYFVKHYATWLVYNRHIISYNNPSSSQQTSLDYSFLAEDKRKTIKAIDTEKLWSPP